jgi:hypothetical protein
MAVSMLFTPLDNLTDASFTQAEKVARVSAKVVPSVTERSFVTTSRA